MKTGLHCISLLLVLGSVGVHGGIITVTTIADVVAEDGECSLREAIVNANNDDQSGSTDCEEPFPLLQNVIRFDPSLAGETITLDNTRLPTVTKRLIIEGPVAGNPDGLTLNGANASRILQAEGSKPDAFTLILRNMTLTGGFTIIDGLAAAGGALRSVNASLELTGIRVVGNSTQGEFARGGGIFVADGDLSLTRSVVTNNQTSGPAAEGGGIALTGGHSILIDSTISGNQTFGAFAHGGGVRVDAISGFNHSLINSTVSGNIVHGQDAWGGGLAAGQGVLSLVHSTVARNLSADGIDGIAYFPAPTIHPEPPSINFHLMNSLVAQAESGEVACSHLASYYENSRATDISCTGSAARFIGLQSLADNGGPTPTHALAANSPAIDAAGDCTALFDNLQLDVADQRGYSRPFGTACDMGAFEFRPDNIFQDRLEQ